MCVCVVFIMQIFKKSLAFPIYSACSPRLHPREKSKKKKMERGGGKKKEEGGVVSVKAKKEKEKK